LIDLTSGQYAFGHRVHKGDTETTKIQIAGNQDSVYFVSSLCALCPKNCPLVG